MKYVVKILTVLPFKATGPVGLVTRLRAGIATLGAALVLELVADFIRKVLGI